MPERRSRNAGRRRRGNDASGAFDAAPGSTLVNFSVVEIREFERVVGDNPSCSSGVPVSIGWNHGKTFTMNLEDFEKARPPRRAQMDLVLTRGERHRLLVEWGASGQDVIEAIRMIIRVKNQRRQTVNNLGSYDRVEEVFENLSRSIKNVVCRTSTNKVARKLQEDSIRASKMKQLQTSGQAVSFTADETLTAASATKKGQDFKQSHGRNKNKPPCREVSVHKDFDSCSTSEAGETLDQGPAKKMPPPEAPEEFPGGRSGRNGRISSIEPIEPRDERRPSQGHMESSEEDCHTRNKTGMDAYDDADDVSNPQSDHHRERMPTPKRGPVESVGQTVDI